MKRTLLTAPLLLSLTACLPAAVAVPVGLISGPTVDRAINEIAGGTPGYTITTDAGIARNKGSKSAAQWCSLFNGTVSWYDSVYFSQESWGHFNRLNADHCERWRLYESGELAKLKGEPECKEKPVYSYPKSRTR